MLGDVGAPPFGALLKTYRLAAGLTQEGLAERAGLSPRGISDLEREVSRTHHGDTVRRLSVALALTPAECGTLERAARGTDRPAHLMRPGTAGPLPPLVGRTREMSLVERHVRGHGPPLLLLAGEPGIGKSRVLQEAAPRAREAGWRVVQGGCRRSGGQGPYAPLLQALERATQATGPLQLRADLRGCAWLVRLLPELVEAPIEPLPPWVLDPAQERRLMFKAVGRYLANVAGPSGTLLVLDDLQWAGSDALDLLTALLDALPDLPLRVIGAYRDTDVAAPAPLAQTLADLAPTGLLARHALAPLDSAAAGSLLKALLAEGAVPPADAAALGSAARGRDERQERTLREQVLRRGGGVPYVIISCVHELQRAGGPVPDALPWDIAESVRQRVALLPPAAQELLAAAAVVGRQGPSALLAGVTAQQEAGALAGLEAACRLRLLEDAGNADYRFAHDVIREVVEADLGTARRAALHRRVAEALEAGAAAASPDQLAYHYARGRVDHKAVLYLERAGDRARARCAHATAEGYYRELVERLDRLGRPQEAAAARETLGAVRTALARYDGALAVLEEAAALYRAGGDREGLGRTLAAIGRAHQGRGTADEGLRRVQDLLDPLAAQGPSRALAALYVALAGLFHISGRFPEQLAAAERAAEIARTVGDDEVRAEAEERRGSALCLMGRPDEGLAVLEAVIPLAEAVGDLASLCMALDLAACVYEDRGALVTTRAYDARAHVAAERSGIVMLIAYITSRCAMSAYFSGAWVQARVEYERAIAICREVEEPWGAIYPLLELGHICVVEGAWDEASGYLEESIALATRAGHLLPLRLAQTVLAERDLWAGEPERARARLLPLLDGPGLEGPTLLLPPTLAWAYLELGEVGQALALATRSVERARERHNQRALVEALRVRALVATHQREWGVAREALEEALMAARRMPYPYAEACLLAACGHLAAAQNECEPARKHLGGALAIFRRLGARKHSEQAEHDLAAL